VQVDFFGSADALTKNVAKEYERNSERYALLKWAQKSFDNFNVVPPNMGICHQVNLEYLGQVITTVKNGGHAIAYPDTLVGTDSHTPMINGIGVMGWGVGGIEAEAVMLGQPYYMSIPEVIGSTGGHPDAQKPRGGGEICRILWIGHAEPDGHRSRHHRQHDTGIWCYTGLLPGR
jgi:aconitase A